LILPVDESLNLDSEGLEVRKELKVFYIGINSGLTFLIFLIMSVRFIFTAFCLFVYVFISVFFADQVGMTQVVTNFFIIYSVFYFFGWVLIVYLFEKDSK
jgi:hypothetical protein